MEPLGGRKLETSECVVDVAGIEVRVCGGDGVRLAPKRLAVAKPGALVFSQSLAPGRSCVHA
jgi:hypothetical protein